jgi:menaquinone-dependent protoporphyrinogen IX oxidase
MPPPKERSECDGVKDTAVRENMIHSRLLNVLLLLLLLLSANTIASCQAGSNDFPVIKKNGGSTEKDLKVLIVYESKYGSTKQYAEWIREDTKGDLINIADGDTPDLAGYDILIIGGYVRMGKIAIAPFIKAHWGVMQGKEVILFTTSGTPPRHPKIRSIYEKSLPEEIQKGIIYFPLPGRISGKDLTLWDKFLIAIGKIVERDETLKKDMGKDFDGVQRENLSPLLEYIEDVKKRSNDRRGQRQ